MKKYKSDIIFFSLLATFILISYFLANIILPFFFGLAFAYVFNPIIRKIQRIVPNRSIAVTFFLIFSMIIFLGSTVLLAKYINNDFTRLNNAIRNYVSNNSENIDETTKKIKSYIDEIYSEEDLKKSLGMAEDDSLNIENITKTIDTDNLTESINTDEIKESISSFTSMFTSSNKEEGTSGDLNWILIFITSIVYFLFIIYDFEYFERKFNKYFKHKQKSKLVERIVRLKSDIKKTFVIYFKQRSKVVLILMFIYTTTFFIVGTPGALFLGFVAGILCFIPYLQYLVLIPLAFSCLMLSIETNGSFFLYFGIIFGIFILSSILEELVLFPKIMKNVSSMNPVIMMVSVSVWSFLLGTFGLLIALPLTSVLLLYTDQLLTYLINEK